MSQENVEIVRGTIVAFNKGENSPTLDAEIVVTPPEGWPDAGEDRVVALFHYVTTGKDSGIHFETAMGAVHTIRNGKIVRSDYFLSPAEALEATGLSE